MQESNVIASLKQELLSHIGNFYTDNINTYTSNHTEKISFRKSIKNLMLKVQNFAICIFTGNNIDNFAVISQNFDELYEMLEDGFSRDLLIKILAYRILGFRKYKLPLNNSDYWALFEKIENEAVLNSLDSIKYTFLYWQLRRFYISHSKEKISLYCTSYTLLNTFYLEQYVSPSNKNIKAESGDIVIDAGGCWGDTALYFAGEVGKLGKVYTFEFITSNLKIMQDNISLNPHLKESIHIVENPLWDSSGATVYYLDNGPSSSISFEDFSPSTMKVKTLTIDDFCQNEKIERLDFIKMDIEGAEINALHGAVVTLKRFKPKLAISLYHKPDDIYTIPMFIDSLKLEYKFYLGHFTIHSEETILYAI
jgi:FkbM family methyltransferase